MCFVVEKNNLIIKKIWYILDDTFLTYWDSDIIDNIFFLNIEMITY
jgi:hypothetical protein